MTSTFGLLNTAYSGLAAAKAALDVTGQNISNVGTTGYTRQRVDQTALGGIGQSPQLYLTAQPVGQGVQVTGIARLNDAFADAQVRQTAGASGYWGTVSGAASTIETGLNEPGDNGLTTTLSKFWSAWQTMGNQAGGSTASSAANALIGSASLLTSRIASGYTAAAGAWTAARSATATTVQQVNDAAAQVARLNAQIKQAAAGGGNANELLDSRDQALQTLSTLAGATVRQNADGSDDVVIGGRTVVAGSTAKTFVLAGATDVSGAAQSPVHLELADQPGVTVQADAGKLAGYLATLAPSNGAGTGGVYAEAAAAYNGMASTLASQVNTASEAGATPDGTTGHDFFAFASASGPAALNLTVVPTSVAGVAAASATTGTSAGGNADAIAQLGIAAGAPDVAWASYVSRIGTQSKNATAQSALATQAAASATSAQTSASGVDLDEETANLVVFQHAYQASARVLTTVDQMLDTLINSTGLVGRG